MKRRTTRGLVIGVLGIAMAFLAACSDGALPEEGGDVTPSESPPPAINFFRASQSTINAGEGVELSWGVSGAEVVKLRSASALLPEQEVKPQDKRVVTDLQTDETFTLTAYNQGVVAQATVEVKVAAKAQLTVKVWAEPATIKLGESTKICYEVSPKEADVKLYDATGNPLKIPGVETPATPEVESATPEATLPEQPVVSVMAATLTLSARHAAADTAMPAETPPTSAPTSPMIPDPLVTPTLPVVPSDEPATPDSTAPATEVVTGCSEPQTPGETTTYRLVASLADGTSKEETVPVTVEGALDAKLYATDRDGKEVTSVAATGQEIVLHWEITGSFDSVTIDDGRGHVVDVKDATGTDGKGESPALVIREKTTYALTVTKGKGEPLVRSITIDIVAPPVTDAKIEVDHATSFPGEPVTFTVSGIPAGVPAEVRWDGGSQPITGNIVTIPPPSATTTYTVYVNNQPVSTRTIAVRQFQPGEAGNATAVGVTGSTRLYGYEGALAGGAVSIKRQEGNAPSEPVSIDYLDPIKGTFGGDGKQILDSLFDGFGPYVVNAIAVDPNDPNKVVVGVTGAVFVSTDGGASFAIVDALPVVAKGNGTHPGCKGSVQKGRESQVANELAGLRQVCDLVILKGGRTLMAYDFGVLYNQDVVGRSKDRGNSAYFWRPGSSLKGIVSNDLAVGSDGRTIYVATEKGVYQSADEGDTFSEVGALGKGAYAVAVAADGTVYAGTANSLQKYTGSSWEAVASVNAGAAKGVYAIVEDPSAAGTLYVGTGAGLYVLRKGGETAANVNEQIGGSVEAPAAVRALAVMPGQVEDELLIGTARGVYSSRGKETAAIAQPEPKPETPPTTTPETPPAPTTVSSALTMVL